MKSDKGWFCEGSGNLPYRHLPHTHIHICSHPRPLSTLCLGVTISRLDTLGCDSSPGEDPFLLGVCSDQIVFLDSHPHLSPRPIKNLGWGWGHRNRYTCRRSLSPCLDSWDVGSSKRYSRQVWFPDKVLWSQVRGLVKRHPRYLSEDGWPLPLNPLSDRSSSSHSGPTSTRTFQFPTPSDSPSWRPTSSWLPVRPSNSFHFPHSRVSTHCYYPPGRRVPSEQLTYRDRDDHNQSFVWPYYELLFQWERSPETSTVSLLVLLTLYDSSWL